MARGSGSGKRVKVMTQKKWLAGTDPMKMLAFIRRKTSDRKIRLFACACIRAVWNDVMLKPARQAVEAAERYADGWITAEQLDVVHCRGISAFARKLDNRLLDKASKDTVLNARIYRTAVAVNTAHDPPFRISQLDTLGTDTFLREISPGLLRCVIGNPFHPVVADPGWLTLTVVQLADAIYTDAAFNRLPVLGDALEEAGCDNADILGHCRQPGSHARGCWVIDLLTGRQ